MSRISKVCISLLLASTSLTIASAQPAEEKVEEGDIIVTGTRATGMQAADSAAPVQLLSADALSKVGQPNLNQALTQMVPSFQAQSQGTDMASFSLSARLRGLNPNHTLVMVNGKRRHGNSIIQVINTAFGGSAAPAIDLIPPDAVQRIEILQEGAAAQYGSDAIAGVINIILKNQDSGGSAQATAGQYYDGEGTQYSVSTNFGLPVGESGFINLSMFHRRNEVTKLGDGQITVRNLNGSTNTNVSAAFLPIYNALNANNGTANINAGQPESQLTIGFFNAGYDFGGVEIYSFGDYSYRDSSALQGYRPPNRICAVTATPSTCFQPTVANGMVPNIEVKQNEFSFTGGIKGETSGWNWDLSSTYAEDKSLVYTTNSANRSLFIDPVAPGGPSRGFTPRDFYDGGFKFTQYVGTIDIRKEFEIGWADPLTVAFGGEYRRETYDIFAGDAGSQYKEGGQSFPGYLDSDAGHNKRTAKAVYANVIAKPVEGLVVDIAGRFEHYSDFGDTTIGKITARYDFTSAFALRGTASTGFRAPTMAESFYSATNVSPTAATLQLQPGSAAARAAGFTPLRPEKSTNFSAGVVVRPIPRLTMTLDGYFIRIKDRIASSGQITGVDSAGVDVTSPLINGRTPADIVKAAIAASGKSIDASVLQRNIQVFTNGIDTETYGVEFAARYPVSFSFGKLDLSVGMNYNDTKITNNRIGPLFGNLAYAIIETSTPKFKSVLGGLFTSGPFSLNARATYYSQSKVLERPNNIVGAPIAQFEGSSSYVYWPLIVKGAMIIDLEAAYDFTSWANLAIGANNLFDKKPEIPGLTPFGAGQNGVNNGTSPYINATTTINAPYNHGPYGTNGGYYYARLTFKF